MSYPELSVRYHRGLFATVDGYVAMEKLNSQQFVTEAALPKSEGRKIDWPVVVVVLAAVSTIAWAYLLLRIFIELVQVAIS